MSWIRLILKKIRAAFHFFKKVVVNLVFIILVLFAGLLMFSGPDYTEIPESGYLVINPNGYLVEQVSYTPLIEQIRNNSFSGQRDVSEISVYDLMAAVDHASQDERISGIVLDLRYFAGGGLSKLTQFADKLIEYREQTGKPVYAFGEYYSQSQYYVAAHATEVFLDPAGSVDLQGFYTYQTYLSGLLERLNIKAHIFKAGDYKSSVEPFSRNSMSPEAREATSSWLNQLWSYYIDNVTEHRIVDQRVASGLLADYLSIYEEVGYKRSELAVRAGLVDTLSSRQAFYDHASETAEHNDFTQISYRDYLQTREHEIGATEHDLPEVRVITVSGEIYYGHSGQTSNAGSFDVINEIQEAREDDNVKAVLLRIDSPGGSAFASELIRTELIALKESGKPVFASFGSTAASGGYWIGLAADRIFATPSTLTGSIGVFGIVFTMEEALSNVGIQSDGIASTEYPFIDSFQDLSQSAEVILQRDVDTTYEQFVGLVAESRAMNYNQALTAANGRVWTGTQALSHGLVDEIGDITEAINSLAEHAELENYIVNRSSKERSFFAQWVSQLFNSKAVESNLFNQQRQTLLPRVLNELEHIEQYNDPRNVYARCYSCQELLVQ
ncbi:MULTISPECIES: signal peptide peptidase SppA [Gammaproteobacteria]|uniref:signal peptide peptidase SppA n=1 Tax=Gammaproteobacteria TaxID=1236 RepID=UPI000DD0E14B|nr:MULTISPECIES: signal peptide peptidase SppA [Gammaproteobacteria]RTE87271.1 signal peptide peptidase SppA [Aliidiomarina sp. B3213]TCZ92942.1 signal peptide peptidase SppA [Lysobacter sp. N42]